MPQSATENKCVYDAATQEHNHNGLWLSFSRIGNVAYSSVNTMAFQNWAANHPKREGKGKKTCAIMWLTNPRSPLLWGDALCDPIQHREFPFICQRREYILLRHGDWFIETV